MTTIQTSSSKPKVALVTGGTRGIGAAIAKQLKEEGYRVVATYQRNEKQALKFAKEADIQVFCWDVKDLDSCKKGVQQIEQDIGPIDVLVNNAGITSDVSFHKMLPKQWNDVIDTNLSSCFNMCQAVIDSMRARNYGRIINISSINGQQGQFGQTNYAAAKAGIIGFTKSLAIETAQKGITVNAIAPGYIKTEMVEAVKPEIIDKIIARIPVGRLGSPEDVANAVSFLASEKTGFMTGSTITLNGGQYLT